ncbi:unnamed protein product, partial [marine sediment metagenome]
MPLTVEIRNQGRFIFGGENNVYLNDLLIARGLGLDVSGSIPELFVDGNSKEAVEVATWLRDRGVDINQPDRKPSVLVVPFGGSYAQKGFYY